MPSRLVLHLNRFNEILHDQTNSYSYPITWESRRALWIYNRNLAETKGYYKTTIGNFLLNFCSLALLIYRFLRNDSGSYPLVKITLSAIYVQISVVSIFLDFLVIRHGQNFVSITNWAYKVDGIPNKAYLISAKKKRVFFYELLALHNEELLNVLIKGKAADWEGLFLFHGNIIYLSAPCLAPFLCVLINADLLAQIIGERNLEQFNNHFAGLRLFTFVGRYLFIFYPGYAMWTGFRLFVLFTTSMAVSYFQILIRVFSLRVSRGALNLYRQLFIFVIVIRELSDKLVGTYICITFVILVAAVNVVMIGYKFQQDFILVGFAWGALMTLIAAILVLKICEYLLETTSRGLMEWSMQAGRNWNKAILKRKTKACRPLYLVMDFGFRMKVNRRVKLGYFDGILIYIFNGMVVCNDLMKHYNIA